MRSMISNFIKRPLQPLALAAAVAFGALSFAAPANAGWHGGGWHGGGGWGWHGGGWGCCWGGPTIGLSFGFPAYSYYPYAPYPYYPPYPAYAPGYSYSQPYYPQQQAMNLAQAPAGPPPQQNWYYCDNPRGFYPYVQNCGAAWRSVPAQPPGTQQPN